MFKADEIFSDIPYDLTGLFDDLPWGILNNLKKYISQNIKSSFKTSDKISYFSPLNTHILIMPDGEIISHGFEVTKEHEDGEKPHILIDGKKNNDATLICAGVIITDSNIQIGKGCVVEPGAMIKGPSIIGNNSEIRHGAYIRGNTIIGDNCVVGHTTEVKSSIFLNRAKAGHFAYIGDSILGNDVNLGAGTKLANLRFAKGNIMIKIDNENYDTGRKKIGAILGDKTQTGCNSVTNPGVITGIGCLICPNKSVSPGYYKANSIIK